MAGYLGKRLLRSLLSVGAVMVIVMLMIYSWLNKELIFKSDPQFTKVRANAKQVYMLQQWEKYGYVDYVPYAEWLHARLGSGSISQETYDAAVQFADRAEKDSATAAKYLAQFQADMEAKGYTFVRLPGITRGNTKKYQEGGEPRVYAYRDIPVLKRLWNYLGDLFFLDTVHYVQEDIGPRGLTFTLRDPAYGGKRIAPAILGNGTRHKYLLYVDGKFPFVHQNLLTLQLGKSYSVRKDTDVLQTITESQGTFSYSTVYYPSGHVTSSADDLHSATYVADSLATGTQVVKENYTDDYTNVAVRKNGLSKIGYSFILGILAVVLSYLVAIPLGIAMALRKDRLLDRLGTAYIVFITAVPALAYIFMFKSLGGKLGLPTTFDIQRPTWPMYVLPILSLALPAIANLMKWLRRYTVDQMHADYVKFARSGGLSEGEIFRGHILKNAIIPIVHGIPGSVLGALTGAIITERVYVVPGVGDMLTRAIGAYDNGVIVGMVLFYAVLTVASVLLGDVLISLVDPRISFTSKAR